MESQTTKSQDKQWYDNKALVIVLLIVFFPVGLYALWKNHEFPKGLKRGLTFLVAIMVTIAVLTDDKDHKKVNKEPTIVSSDEKPVKTDEETIEKSIEIKTLSTQEIFISEKSTLYENEYLNAQNSAQRSLFFDKSKKFSKQFLDSINYTLTDWVGEISMIQLGYKTSDIELLKKLSPNQVKEKDPTGRPIGIAIVVSNISFSKGSYNLTTIQEQDSKNFKGGVLPTSPLYEILLGLKEGQKIIFSANVKDITEYNTDIQHATIFKIELTDINK